MYRASTRYYWRGGANCRACCGNFFAAVLAAGRGRGAGSRDGLGRLGTLVQSAGSTCAKLWVWRFGLPEGAGTEFSTGDELSQDRWGAGYHALGALDGRGGGRGISRGPCCGAAVPGRAFQGGPGGRTVFGFTGPHPGYCWAGRGWAMAEPAAPRGLLPNICAVWMLEKGRSGTGAWGGPCGTGGQKDLSKLGRSPQFLWGG